ncbi:hypothetical protein QTP88_017474 [Uroleucon formosanum]
MENELKRPGKHGFRIGTWNIRSLYKPGALKSISDAIKKYKNVLITALQEIRWPEGSVKTEGMTLFYSGNKNGRHINGVGFLVSELLLPHVKHFEPINDRICYMRIADKSGDLMLICVYAPTENGPNDEKEVFYEELERTYDKLPNHCSKILLGDFNAQVGNEKMYKPTVGGESAHDISNGNGMRLIEYNIDKLCDNATIEQYQKGIDEQLNQYNPNLDENVDDAWKRIKNSILNVVDETIQRQRKDKIKPWFIQKCEDLIKKRNQARLKILQFPTQANIEVYESKKKEATKIIRQHKRTAEKEKIKEMEKYRRNPKEFFRRCKSLKNGYKPAICSLINEKGDLIMNSKDIAEEFKNYFNKMLNNNNNKESEIVQGDSQEEEDIIIHGTEESTELQPREDGIFGEFLKIGGQQLRGRKYRLILLIWQKEQIPKEWEMAIICPIFKKNDPKQVANYRGISLLDVGYKVLLSPLLGRLQKYAEEIIDSYQCGFRKGKSTTDHIFAIRQILEKHHEYNKDIHLVFVDFKQAYDNINCNKLWTALKKFGIPEKLVRLIKMCNSNTQNVFRIMGEISEPFIVKNGLRQGDALSPVLLNLALEEIIRSLPRGQRMEVNEGYTCLAYADDLVLLGDTRQDVIQILSDLMKASKQMGLSVNQEETKYMLLSRKTKSEENMKDLEVDGLTFQQVSSFKYLGVNVNNTNCMHEEIKLRLQSANKAYFAMLSLFKSRFLSKKTKEKLYTIYLRPIATYGCNTWASTGGDYKKLLVFERKILRKMYGPVFDDSEQKWLRGSNEDLKNLYPKEDIVQFVRSSRLA